jgi:hypothetical protein
MKNIKIKGLDENDLGKLTLQKLAASETGIENANSGLLARIGILGGKTQGNRNVATGHMKKINSISSEERSERLKTFLTKKELIKSLKSNFYMKDIADEFEITQVTLRRILKEYNIDYKKYIKTPTDLMNKKYASGGGAKTNKPILCFYYPEMKPFKKKKFNSIKDANDYFNVTSVSSVVTGKTKSIKWNNKKITFKKI